MLFLKYDSRTGIPLEVCYHEYPSFSFDKYIEIDNDLATLVIYDIRRYRIVDDLIVKLTDSEYNYYLSQEMITIRNQLLASTDSAILYYLELSDKKRKKYLTKSELSELIDYRNRLRELFNGLQQFDFYKFQWPTISVSIKDKLMIPTAEDLITRW